MRVELSPTVATREALVDLGAVLVNLAALRSMLGARGVIVDLGGDARGHGLVPVAQALEGAPSAMILVDDAEERATLADAGVTLPIAVRYPDPDSPGSRDAPAHEWRAMPEYEPGDPLPSGIGPVRLGAALYGLSARVGAVPDARLRPALTLRAPVMSVKRVAAEEGVSYGYTYRTRRRTTLALVPLGYADGVDRAAGNLVEVLLGQTRFTIAGRVAMDAITLDVGEHPVRVGDIVVAFGDPAGGAPSAFDWAAALGVSAESIAARLGRRVPRRYLT